MSTPAYHIRKAKQGDEGAILALIKMLAEFENEPHQVINTAEQLAIDLFQDGICACFVAESEENIIGIALYYTSYSTWYGRSLYLEDIIIDPAYRRLGIGKSLFSKLIEEAKNSGAKRMDWQVLEWNSSAIEFYKSVGAKLDSEWVNGRLYF
ncbi:MAG: GNAT family N-acetyltransferase [Brumimicrobium sp.]|nr:GNAT family N-acetyltransferase [Brumimicrobium sp.]MCO5267322.1 GNAT family N-acetyltransferase [Brumimicrobium sp.]